MNSYFDCPIMSWLPVIEPDLEQERFLVQNPNKSFREGNFTKVNVMTGITENEFASPVAGWRFVKIFIIVYQTFNF